MGGLAGHWHRWGCNVTEQRGRPQGAAGRVNMLSSSCTCPCRNDAVWLATGRGFCLCYASVCCHTVWPAHATMLTMLSMRLYALGAQPAGRIRLPPRPTLV